MADDALTAGCLAVEQRLVEWAGWLRAGDLMPKGGPDFDSERRPRSERLPGDGGMVRSYLDAADREALDERARQLQKMIREMPPELQELVKITYLTPCVHDALPRRAAALRLGINETLYRIRKAQALAWVMGRLGVAAMPSLEQSR